MASKPWTIQVPSVPMSGNKTIRIYTDGACKGNPGPGGYGVVLIRIDTREQTPLEFEHCAAIPGTIKTFDYAIEGDQDSFAVERKSLSDLIQSLAAQKNWIRELKKIRRARAAGFPRLFYVVAANREDIENFDYSVFTRGRIGAAFIFHQLSELEYVFDVHVIFSGDALGAARDIHRLLKRRSEDLRAQEGNQ